MDQKYQHWLFALSAPTAAMNIEHGASYVDPKFYPNDPMLDLNDSWGIDSKSSLIDTVIRMIDNGHAEELSYPYYLWHQLSPLQWKNYIEDQEEERLVSLEFVSNSAAICGSGGIKSWDLSRMSFLCRIGVLNQWLTEEESLWFHSRIASRARHFYGSWQEYTAGFLIGRTFWLALGEERPEFKRYALSAKGGLDSNVSVALQLSTSPDSPYKHLSWDIDPTELEIEKPASLQEVDWS
ncbi:DUF1266 domain-containing protein [Pragia fontium]|uniref:DUF1266 domain-containing protein n=1 Tax=Pragia fontium DSM 5563 = ATCC 49100 TaxID=1122977 RepID=A0AAJ4WDE8_9GAMM|nr:DUF1266 domain-containing protein [Pragia fontium]SFD39987.1 Protein of unknown function [Pragia fontium DSM 5563 = ATCC 49100]VEJ52727.1 Protein of uncharacterised function (DUF1266) [Pragia fontium]